MMNKKVIFSELAPVPIGPYSQAILVGNLLFVSGQIAIQATNGAQLLTGNIEDETRLVMKNIEAILGKAGLTFGNIVKTTIFLKDLKNFEMVNKVYGSYFTHDFPARETVEVSRLPKDVNVEISVIAAVPATQV